MATDEQVAKAITAVAAGVANSEQKKLATAAAKQAGSTGNAAREAFK